MTKVWGVDEFIMKWVFNTVDSFPIGMDFKIRDVIRIWFSKDVLETRRREDVKLAVQEVLLDMKCLELVEEVHRSTVHSVRVFRLIQHASALRDDQSL